MNRKRAIFVLLPVLGLFAGYLFFFWRERLRYYGVDHVFPVILLTVLSLWMAVYRPIPVKIRTIFVLYLTIFGLLADMVNLVIRSPLWELLYGSGIAVCIAAALAFLWGSVCGKSVQRTQYDIPISRKTFRPLKIGLLSDIHMGLCVDREKLNQVCSLMDAEALDMLLLAGDLCDDYTSLADMQYAIHRLGQISTRLGTFCVFGNHDLASHGPALQYTESELRQALSQANIQLLDDEAVTVGEVVLLGRRDPWMAQRWGGRRAAAQLLPENTGSVPVLILDHQPYDAKEAALAGADLQLSGHTHAGQVWPASWLGRLSPTFYGMHAFSAMTLVVSSGLGGRGNRLRSGCSAEYVILKLHPHTFHNRENSPCAS